METINVVPIPVLKDNYVWAVVAPKTRDAIIVDPGVAEPVADYLDKNQLNLRGILITHHHWDHTNGLLALKNQYDIPVFGPTVDKVEGVTYPLKEGDTVEIENFPVSFSVIDIPGHTHGHIAYVGAGGVFCGDTLFSAGCGRLFEGTAAQMSASLAKLSALPDQQRVYCGHEYTLNNLRFAEMVEPVNKSIAAYHARVAALRAENQPSLPSTIQIEKEVNPFLRCHVPEVIARIKKQFGVALTSPVEVFKYLRQWKDGFS